MRLLIVFLVILTTPVLAQPIEPQSCIYNATHKLLDFWLGDWNVYVGENLVGTNTTEETMKGCAVLKHWQSVDGGCGMSLFYVDGQGRIFAEDNKSHLDRTTLTNLGTGDVRQLILASIDEGASWRPEFDTVYRKRMTP